MNKVVLIGCGNVGMAYAYALGQMGTIILSSKVHSSEVYRNIFTFYAGDYYNVPKLIHLVFQAAALKAYQ